MNYIFGPGKGPKLPVVVMASDVVHLPLEGGVASKNEPSPIDPMWQRWNDYGIGLLLEGGNKGGQKGELKQAEAVFLKVVELGPSDGWVNLARVYNKEGRIADALAALDKAAHHEKPAAPWVINWLTGEVNVSNGMIEAAIENYESVLNTRVPDRKLDFSLDFVVINELASRLYELARIEFPIESPKRLDYLKRTIAAYRRTLDIDSEDFAAHYGLGLAYGDSAWRAVSPGATSDGDGPQTDEVSADTLLKLASSVADPKTRGDASARRQAGLRLARDVARFMDGPRPQYQSRLEPLHEIVELLGPVWDLETDPAARVGLARALEVTHKRLHERLKPDETAEGLAFAKARARDPAANQNAQSIVIHSLHRTGAPGIDPPPAKVGLKTAPETPTALNTPTKTSSVSEKGQ